MEPFLNIPRNSILYFLNYYNVPHGENIYLTAWNFILQNKDKNILVPLSIHNYLLDYNLHQTLRISGPISWFQFKIGDKTYDLFGDEHWSKDYSCQNEDYTINDLIDLIAKVNTNKNIITDIYLEEIYSLKESTKPLDENKGYLGEIIEKLDKCLTPHKTECQYNTKIIRFHYTDLRTIYGRPSSNRKFIQTNFSIRNINKTILDEDLNSFNEYLDAVKFIILNSLVIFEYFESTTSDFILNIDKIIKALPETKYGDIFRRKLENFKYFTSKRNNINIHKIAIQLLNIHDNYIKNMIIKFIHNDIKYLQKQALSLMNDIKIVTDKTIVISIINNYFTYLDGNLMDEYLLGRLFKYSDSKYAMIYVGNSHVKKYVIFFEKYLNIQPIKIGINNPKRCITNYSFY